jgi:tRNA(Ile)-lysidine synthase
VRVAEAPSALNGGLGGLDGLMGFTRVAVAVSGGSDSMALLHMAQQWRGQADVFALTVDHGLREGSAAEALQVANWCAALAVPHVVLRWEGVKPSSGVQAKARVARYDLMSQWCRANSVPALMTAHTADDQAETVAMRLLRTQSARSLAAIWPENEWQGVKLLRPFLAMRRQALRDRLMGLGQPWLEDPSNANTAFERIRVRQAMCPDDVMALQARAGVAQAEVTATDEMAARWRQAHVTVDAYGVVRFSRPAWQAEALEVRQTILAWVLSRAGDGTNPELAALTALCNWAGTGAESRRSLAGAVVAARRQQIEVMREPARMRQRWTEVSTSGHFQFDGRFDVHAPVGSFVGPMGQPPLLKRLKQVPALAFSALPVVKLAGGQLFSAVGSGRPDIFSHLSARFSL